MACYAATNDYASETSIGFCNTWNVWAFSTKVARDVFVGSRSDLATRAITKQEIGKYVEHPKPFSGNRRVIVENIFSPIANLVGMVEIGNDDSPGYVMDLN